MATGAARRLRRRRAGLSARHRRPRPRRAVALDLRHAGRRSPSPWSPPACLPDRHGAGPARRLVRRLVDAAISRLVDIWMAFPPVLLSIILVAMLGTGLYSVISAIVVIDWTRFCRVVRAETMAQARWTTSTRAAHRLLAPGDPVARNRAQRRASADRAAHAGNGHRRHRRSDPVVRRPVGFLGHADLGRHDRARGARSCTKRWWVLAAPLVALFATVLAFNQLGDGWRRSLDPVLRR